MSLQSERQFVVLGVELEEAVEVLQVHLAPEDGGVDEVGLHGGVDVFDVLHHFQHVLRQVADDARCAQGERVFVTVAKHAFRGQHVEELNYVPILPSHGRRLLGRGCPAWGRRLSRQCHDG